MGGETRVSPLIAHGPFMGSAGIVRGSGRGRAFRVGLSERVGVRAALFVPRRAVFRISARTARTDRAHHLSGGPPRPCLEQGGGWR